MFVIKYVPIAKSFQFKQFIHLFCKYNLNYQQKFIKLQLSIKVNHILTNRKS